MQILVRMSKRFLIDPWFWRIVGFVSSIVAFTCFALSPSFYDLFGRWNLLKGVIYSVVSLILTTLMLLVKKCTRFTRSVLVKANMGFVVMMLTSLFSIWQDRVSQKENDENGSRGRILNMCSFGAFGLMSLSLSRRLELGFEVGIFNFLLGSFLVLLMKMNFKLAPIAAILCYVIINIRSFSDYFMEKLGRADSSDTVPLEDMGSGPLHSKEEDMESGPLLSKEEDMESGPLLSKEEDMESGPLLSEEEDMESGPLLSKEKDKESGPLLSKEEDIESGSPTIHSEPKKHHPHKDRLEEYAKMSGMGPPAYDTNDLGASYPQQFESAVLVGGMVYVPRYHFSNPDDAEEDIAKHAHKYLTDGVKDNEISRIVEEQLYYDHRSFAQELLAGSSLVS